MSESNVVLGVIGGSGLYQMEGAKLLSHHKIDTPYGSPSDQIAEIEVGSRKGFFLPRHGSGHKILPSEVNYRANIYAMKSLGVTHIMAINACGIMKEEISPGDMVIPDQIFDRTKGIRASTFFGDGIAGHVAFADPFCHEMSGLIDKAARMKTDRVHTGGTYVCMEGPQFSTRAESNFYRKTLAPAVIGMTAIPEAKLAREAEICYGMLALATDYDCWHEGEDDVSVEAVLAVLKANAALANSITATLMEILPETSDNECSSAAKFSIITQPDMISEKRKKELSTLYGKYFG